MFSIYINIKYSNFIYYCIKADDIKLSASYIQLSLESLFWLDFFDEVLHFYSQSEGHESHNTTSTFTFLHSCNTEQHSVALKIYS